MKKMEAFEPLKNDKDFHQAIYRCRVCLRANFGRVKAKPEEDNDALKFSECVIKMTFPQNFRHCRICGASTVQDLCQILPAKQEEKPSA